MLATVKLSDVVEAIDSAMEEHFYYLDRRTGEIVLLSSDELEAAEEDELISEYPDWQRDSILKAHEVLSNPEEFFALPDQTDIDAYKIMEDFCLALKDNQARQDLLQRIKGRGAFGRFKDAIHSRGIENDWYEFKRRELEKIAIDWLEENKIPYSCQDTLDATGASI